MSIPIGCIISYVRTPSSPVSLEIFLICDGSEYLGSLYPDLYNKFVSDNINTNTNGYGVVSSNTGYFKVPDLRNRMPIMSQGYLGSKTGNTQVTVTSSNLPAHSHTPNSLKLSHSHNINNVYYNNPLADYAQGFGRIGGNQVNVNSPRYSTQNIFADFTGTKNTQINVTVGTDNNIGSDVSYEIINSYIPVDYYIKF